MNAIRSLSSACFLLSAVLLNSGLAVAQSSGGPNTYGYTWDAIALDQVSVPSGVQSLPGVMTDDGEEIVDLPSSWANGFSFYGVNYSQLTVSSNGAIAFNSSAVGYSNTCLPATSTTAPQIMPHWDDLNPTNNASSAIYGWHDTVAGADRFVVSWEDVPHYGFGNTDGATFQVHLYPSGAIEMHYVDLALGDALFDHLADATVGIQDVPGAAVQDPLEYSCNTVQANLAGSALRFSTCDDLDGDGYGDVACGGSDCNDGDAQINPGAAEICDAGVDNDCDSSTDESVDGDGDNQTICGISGDGSDGDCDDADPANSTGNAELCDGQDNDCNGLDDFANAGVAGQEVDADADGALSCEDCNDADDTAFPGNSEICDGTPGAGVDNDCDGDASDELTDGDGDGFAPCDTEFNGALNDCDDTAVDHDGDSVLDGFVTYPGATELCDGIDNNCDNVLGELDVDGDGFLACEDCDDNDADIYPAADLDADGFSSCPDSTTAPETDCDDNEALAFPGNPEVCDGLDSDCNGTVDDRDIDGDGDYPVECGGGDCDDTDPNVGAGTDDDQDGFDACDDCNDGDATIYPGAPETCDGANVDSDCDGLDDNVDFDVGSSAAFSSSFDGSDGGLIASAPAGSTSVWEHGVPTSGPGASLSGTELWATVLGGDYAAVNNEAYLDTAPITIPTGAAVLSFSYWQDNESSCLFDYTVVQIDDGSGVFADLADGDSCSNGLADTEGLWVDVDIDLSSYSGNTITLRFKHTTDGSVSNYPGTYIDDLFIGILDDSDGDGYVDSCGDCDSSDPSVYPGAPETCGDGTDQDCDTFDLDLSNGGDVDGDQHYSEVNCLNGDDCDDNDASLNPSQDADADGSHACEDCDDSDGSNFPGNSEICGDGLDQNCDTVDALTDSDGDGYHSDECVLFECSDPAFSDQSSCEAAGSCSDSAIADEASCLAAAETWTSANNSWSLSGQTGDDCDDSNAAINPGVDADGDGAHVCEDCNDNQELQFPGNPEVCGDFIDNDCDDALDNVDADLDGYIDEACSGGDDCDDSDATINPELDADADGAHACVDCDDSDATSLPGGTEVCDDGIDQDCSGADLLSDGDGDGSIGSLCGGDDCDDDNAAIHPGAEDLCDGVDMNCDGETYEVDADGDTFFDEACGGTDCDDDAQGIHPAAPEICDGIDNNCDEVLFEGGEDDLDEDGVPICDDDCDDNDPDIFPGAQELCDGIDNDCDDTIDDGVIRDSDQDGAERLACGGDDCDDGNSSIGPGQAEDCADGLDNDCDELVDSADESCASQPSGCSCEGNVVTGEGSSVLALLAVLGVLGSLRRRRGGLSL